MSRTAESQLVAEELEAAGIHEIDEDAVEISDEDIDTIFSDDVSEDALTNDEDLYADPVETAKTVDEEELDDLDDDPSIDEEDDERVHESQRMWIRAANYEDRFKDE